MSQEKNHIFVPELDTANNEINYKIDAFDLLIDLKVLIKEYYAATFTENEKELILTFNNGQKFKIAISEIN